MPGDGTLLQAKLDSVVSTQAAVTQLYCNQRSLEAEAGMVEADLMHLQVLMRKYGSENFVEGEAMLLQEREKLGRKLAKVVAQIQAMDGHVQANLAYSAAVQQPRGTSPPRSANPSPSWPRTSSPAFPVAAAAAGGAPHPSGASIPPQAAADRAAAARPVYPSIPQEDAYTYAALPNGHPVAGHKIPTYTDSRILANSSEFMAQGRNPH
eukprot:TRINITY_DN14167_c0_g1_i1.p1 TRINITY_DN14167_c0_g1~~TRINITY_DN14167_c0_g1_i1.p1  ORF type:complete len:237 (+),score=75.47 TRINITY_DN14167_c0_g1_i1:86-712(+)